MGTEGMSEPDDQLRDHLRDLVSHPGFALLKAHVIDEWGADRVLARQLSEPDVTKWPRFHEIRLALDELLSWPEREVARRQAEQQRANAAVPLVPRRA
jgi:hypothetical protein